MSLSAHQFPYLLLAGVLALPHTGCRAVRNVSNGFAECAPTSAQPEVVNRDRRADYQFDRPFAPPAALPPQVAASPLQADSPADGSHPGEEDPAGSRELPVETLDIVTIEARLEARGAKLTRDPDLSVISIDLSNTDVIDDDLEQLHRFSKLQQLNLAGTRVSNAALDSLSQSAQLEYLGLTGTRIDDDGIPAITRLTRLRFLSLAGTNVTDDGLESLSRMRTLEAINLRSTRVTPQGVTGLQSRLPDCRIVVDDEVNDSTSSLHPGSGAQGASPIQRRLYPIPNREVAQRHLEVLLRTKLSDPEVLHALAALRAAEGNWDEARTSIRCALEQRTGDRGLRFDYAVTLANCGDLEAAYLQFARAVGAAAAHHNLGVLLVEQGQVAAGRRQFQQAITADPAMDSARDWLAYLDGDRTRPPSHGGPGLLSAAELQTLFGAILGDGTDLPAQQPAQVRAVEAGPAESLFQPSSPFDAETTWFTPISLSAARGW